MLVPVPAIDPRIWTYYVYLSNVIRSIADIPLVELVDAKRRAESEELSVMLTACCPGRLYLFCGAAGLSLEHA